MNTTYQILTNDDEVYIPSISSILLAVWLLRALKSLKFFSMQSDIELRKVEKHFFSLFVNHSLDLDMLFGL